MLKTTNYNLNKPEAADPLRLADFNENAEIIDAALGELNTAVGAVPSIVMGTYTGDGTRNRTVSLGFTPKVVFVCDHKGATCYCNESGTILHCGGLALPGAPITYGSTTALAIVDGGFQVNQHDGSYSYSRTNTSNLTYHYMALR